MDKLRVVVNGTEVGNYSSETMGLSITWQNKSISEINSFSSPFTKTVKLPLTKELSLACGHPQEIDSVEFVSLKNRYEISIYLLENITADGYIKPVRVILNGLDEFIEFTIEPKEKEWVTELREFNLTELDYSDQDHTLTVTEIRDRETYDINVPYVYPPIDIAEVTRLPVLWIEQTGTDIDYYYLGSVVGGSSFIAHAYGFENTDLNLNWQQMIDVPDATWNGRSIYIARTQGRIFASTKRYDQKGYLYVQGYTWQVGDFYPCIRIKDILTRCFERIGWQVNVPESTYLDDKFHYQHNIEILNKYEEPRNLFRVKVYSGGYEVSGIAGGPPSTTVPKFTVIVPFVNSTEAGMITNVNYDDTDSDSYVNVIAGTNESRYVAPETIIIRLTWNYYFTIETVTGFLFNYGVRLKIEHYDSANTLLRTVVNTLLPTTAQNWNVNPSKIQEYGTIQSSYMYMNAGDYVQCKYEVYNLSITSATSITFTINGDNILESVMYKGGNFRNKEIRLNEYLPEKTALEWLKDIALINNLQFYTNEKLKTVYAIRDDNKRTGKKIDFTRRINTTREIEIEEVCGYHPKTYNFNWLKDTEDWSIDFIELATGERFAKGVVTNLNVYTQDEVDISNSIYSATLDKFESNGVVKFNTVEMKGKETWKSLPTWKRVDYQPRYLTLTFGETLEDNGLPYDGGVETGILYQIEGDGTPLTYVRPEFQTVLHWGSSTTGLLGTFYKNFIRILNYGIIVRAYTLVDERNVDSISTILTEDNDFRADYDIQVKSNVSTTELNKIIDYNPSAAEDTQVEFIVIKDE